MKDSHFTIVFAFLAILFFCIAFFVSPIWGGTLLFVAGLILGLFFIIVVIGTPKDQWKELLLFMYPPDEQLLFAASKGNERRIIKLLKKGGQLQYKR